MLIYLKIWTNQGQRLVFEKKKVIEGIRNVLSVPVSVLRLPGGLSSGSKIKIELNSSYPVI